MKKLLMVLVVALVVAVPAATANPTPLGWNRYVTIRQGCNDLQSTATNCVTDTPTANGGQPCTWGDEDDLEDAAAGKLAAGQTTSDTLCMVTDWCNDGACPHMALYQVTDSGPYLQVTLSDDRGDVWPSPAPVKIGTTYYYQSCVADPVWDAAFRDYAAGGSPYPPLPGTNGGLGLFTNYTLTVTATKTTQFSGAFELGENHSDPTSQAHNRIDIPCPAINPPV